MDLRKYYNTTRTQSLNLCSSLKAEDYVVQPSEFASPPKWHLAHTTWFFEEFILKQYIENYKPFDESFGFLFNSYYNNVGNKLFREKRGNITRPNITKVFKYRNHVDALMNHLLEKNDPKGFLDLVILGINHEEQHQELLLSDIKYLFGHNPIFPVYKKHVNLVKDKNESSGYCSVRQGTYTIGHQGKGFCYDNELGVHKVYLNDFEISHSLVTNGEFIEFIDDGGYKNFNLWLDEGLSWINTHKICSPLYWHKMDGKWHIFTLSGLHEIDPDAILCHISFYEALAFAEWKGLRLPTEFEWEIASDKFDWGKRWEWTHSAYLPYPKFKKANGAVGEYNGKFMINQMVLRGASVATSSTHSRKTYRNFFHANERWQFTGIRLAK